MLLFDQFFLDLSQLGPELLSLLTRLSQLYLTHCALLLKLCLMLLLLRVCNMSHSFKLCFDFGPFMVNSLNLELHVVFLLNNLVALRFKFAHFELIVFLGLLKLLVMLVSLLGFDLATCQLILILLLHALNLSFEKRHDLHLLIEQVTGNTTNFSLAFTHCIRSSLIC